MISLRVSKDITLVYETFGDVAAPPVLLIPGAGAPAAFWPDHVCATLAGHGYRVVRYCHRDTGLSTHVDRPYPIDALLTDMRALLDHLGDGPGHLIGHSMGGYLVQLAMTRFPDRLRTATSISAGPAVQPEQYARLNISVPSAAVLAALGANQPTGDFETDLPGWMKSWRLLSGTRGLDEARAVAYTRALYVGDPRNAQVAVHHIHAMTTVPSTLAADLARARTPFLVIHGQQDPLVPLDNGVLSARLVPNATLAVLKGAGHMFFSDDTWQEILDAILGHVARPSHTGGS